MPDLDHGICDRIASSHIDDLSVEDELHTFLILNRVLTNVFAIDVVWTLSDLRGENTRAVAGEENGFIGGICVCFARQMRGSINRRDIPNSEVRSIY